MVFAKNAHHWNTLSSNFLGESFQSAVGEGFLLRCIRGYVRADGTIVVFFAGPATTISCLCFLSDGFF